MTQASGAHLFDVLEHTWPAAGMRPLGPWLIRDGRGGGKRVSAATARTPARAEELPAAEAAMRALGELPRFMIRPGEETLDSMLEAAGYRVIDPVVIYNAPIATLTQERPPRIATFDIWEPMAIQRDIWAAGGIGPARLAVMQRVQGPKTALFGRDASRPAATGFVAAHAGAAMVHALEVLPAHRRHGLGRRLMTHAAFWAAARGAAQLAVACTTANAAACALYAGLGMTPAAHYHYREHPEGAAP
ncbi:GNAT family N-acetyltransferase [Roseovarius spongiae]|uniref:GNAT family N-acetyltransferase n=1 Tax=Roseovarius spongiae TaxID=2320272 RepID=A0A3A8AUT1_9RHOB|nr:GNAT family N-acetyltransferase [Roseovarius spongiae]RKF14797.1 GNAT family N-acetyltransferase [Roseovarius spongiae]